MADTETAFWQLTKPEIGASRDTWGAKWNDNLDAIDALLASVMPIGTMVDFAGAAAPLGWLLLDGTLHTISSFPKLFATLGVRFGGDGVTTFGVPDSRCRVTVGVGSNVADALAQLVTYALGDIGGAQGAQITQNELPNYQLPLTGDGAHGHGNNVTEALGGHSHTGYTDFQGDHAHNVTGAFLNAGGYYIAGGGGTTAFNATLTTDVQGLHQHAVQTYNAGGHAHGFTVPGNTGQHNHFIALGGGGQILKVTTMYLAVTKIIFAAPPTFQTLAPDDPFTRLLRSPMRGNA